jgi:alpha-amylase
LSGATAPCQNRHIEPIREDRPMKAQSSLRLPLFLALTGALALAGCAHAPQPPTAAAAPGPVAGAPAAAAPAWQLEWARGATFYEIFVRSFADSDGDGVGDLRGLTAKLDYLNDGDPATTADLGVEALWLMPIFASPSYHGYDTTDYRAINPDYGTMDDFLAFIAAAHARGIKVVVDLVINHTSDRHPWFVESASSLTSAKRDWYVWSATDPGWMQPWGGGPSWHEKNGAYYYGIFWSGMPDLNMLKPEVRSEVESIADYWLERGVDGFRLDAARHIVADGPGEAQNDTPETHAFWKEFSAHVRAVDAKALLVGENWTTSEKIAPYYGSTVAVAGGDELPMSFDFPLGGAIVESVQMRDGSPVAETLADVARLYPAGVLDGTFITNHDMPRVATQLGGNPAALRSAAAILLTLPGTPFVYYGEEVGLAGDKPDPDIRTPMPWDDGEAGGGFTTGTPWHLFAKGRAAANVAAQAGDPASLLSLYRRLIHLRAGSPALRHGATTVLSPGAGSSPVLAFVREADGERVLAVHNLGVAQAVAGPWALQATAAELLLASADGASAVAAGAISVTLPPGGSAVWRLR